MPQRVHPSEWYDPVTVRIDDETGLVIPEQEWNRWTWYDVTTMSGYQPGVHRYVKMRFLGENKIDGD